MLISDFRKELRLSQEAFARKLNLTSKAHISQIESDNACSVRVALEIERMSRGRISASDLNTDVALVRQKRAPRGSRQDAAA